MRAAEVHELDGWRNTPNRAAAEYLKTTLPPVEQPIGNQQGMFLRMRNKELENALIGQLADLAGADAICVFCRGGDDEPVIAVIRPTDVSLVSVDVEPDDADDYGRMKVTRLTRGRLQDPKLFKFYEVERERGLLHQIELEHVDLPGSRLVFADLRDGDAAIELDRELDRLLLG